MRQGILVETLQCRSNPQAHLLSAEVISIVTNNEVFAILMGAIMKNKVENLAFSPG